MPKEITIECLHSEHLSDVVVWCKLHEAMCEDVPHCSEASHHHTETTPPSVA